MAVRPVSVAEVDRELLAAKAIVDADGRSTGTGGRFCVFDVRAGVLRAIAASGVVADRTELGRAGGRRDRDWHAATRSPSSTARTFPAT